MNASAPPPKTSGIRLTPQRLVILQILSETEGHISPAEIYRLAKERMPGITEATIYRTLEFLSSQGLVLATLGPNGHLIYEDATHDHHHLVCRRCGSTVEIEPKCLAALYQQFEADTGFQVDASHLTFFGICPACRQAYSN